MPILKKHLETEPLVKVVDKMAQKNGLRRTIYSINGDQYTGEWKDNMRHGNSLCFIDSGLFTYLSDIVKTRMRSKSFILNLHSPLLLHCDSLLFFFFLLKTWPEL